MVAQDKALLTHVSLRLLYLGWERSPSAQWVSHST